MFPGTYYRLVLVADYVLNFQVVLTPVPMAWLVQSQIMATPGAPVPVCPPLCMWDISLGSRLYRPGTNRRTQVASSLHTTMEHGDRAASNNHSNMFLFCF